MQFPRFTDKEIALMKALKNKQSGWLVTHLSMHINIPRTTTHFLLKKLKEAGFVEAKLKGKRNYWYSVDTPSKKTVKFLKDLGLFDVDLDGARDFSHHIKHIKGFSNIIQAIIQEIKILTEGSRIFSIQNTKSVRHAFIELPEKDIVIFHKLIKKKKIVLEGVSEKSAVDLLSTTDKDSLESHMGRATIVTLVEDGLLSDFPEVHIIGNMIVCIDYQSKSATIVRSKIFSQVIKSCIRIFTSQESKKLDLNSLIKSNIH